MLCKNKQKRDHSDVPAVVWPVLKNATPLREYVWHVCMSLCMCTSVCVCACWTGKGAGWLLAVLVAGPVTVIVWLVSMNHFCLLIHVTPIWKMSHAITACHNQITCPNTCHTTGRPLTCSVRQSCAWSTSSQSCCYAEAHCVPATNKHFVVTGQREAQRQQNQLPEGFADGPASTACCFACFESIIMTLNLNPSWRYIASAANHYTSGTAWEFGSENTVQLLS